MYRTNEYFYDFMERLHSSGAAKDHVSLKAYRQGDYLLQQNSPLARVLIIREGIAKCIINEENGKDFILAFLGTGQLLGELEVLRNTRCLNNVQALTSLVAYAVSVPYFRHIVETDKAFNAMLLQELANRLAITSTRASLQQLYTVEHGLRNLLRLLQQQHMTLSKEDMAAYLGITVRSLNRALKTIGEE